MLKYFILHFLCIFFVSPVCIFFAFCFCLRLFCVASLHFFCFLFLLAFFCVASLHFCCLLFLIVFFGVAGLHVFCLVALLVACVFVCVASDHFCYVCPCLWSCCLAMLWCSSYPHTEFLPPSCGSWIIGLVWRLGAFQKGPGAKGTRMEECKKNAKARGEGDEGGKKNAKIMQKKCNQNAKKMQK